jgi:dihydrofolate synthase/folylpolyglutamate synthase
MTYRDAIEFLFSLQMFGTTFGLEAVQRLAERAGSPHKELRFIHVAGTNGKGSTCAMLDSIYRAAGWRVGLYTSPHLVSFRERIQVDRRLIPEGDVARLVTEAQQWLADFSKENHPTFFEVVTVIALRYFAEQKCDVVIWETGLGGRLDATNIVTPLASVITNVQFDHEKWLGDTLEKIATEKAGVIKPGVPVITAAEAPEALKVIRETAARLNAPLHVIGEQSSTTRSFLPGLRGAHQRINAALAVRTVEVVRRALPFNNSAIERGLASVPWPGRFQVLERGQQTLVLDGAHNPAGARALAETLRAEFSNRPLTLVLGVLEDKNWETVCRTLAPLGARIIVTPVSSRRTSNPEALVKACRDAQPRGVVSAVGSLDEALNMTRRDDIVVVTGSLYLVGEAMELLGLGHAGHERALNEWTASATHGKRTRT